MVGQINLQRGRFASKTLLLLYMKQSIRFSLFLRLDIAEPCKSSPGPLNLQF